MSKAEDRALKAYPIKMAEREGYDENLRERKGFVKGYHQAEKDLELTWNDLEAICSIAYLYFGEFTNEKDRVPSNKELYKEVLKRFNEQRGKGI